MNLPNMIHGHISGTAVLAYAEKQRNKLATCTPLFFIYQGENVKKKMACEHSHFSLLLGRLCSIPFLIPCKFVEKVRTRAKKGNDRAGERSIHK